MVLGESAVPEVPTDSVEGPAAVSSLTEALLASSETLGP